MTVYAVDDEPILLKTLNDAITEAVTDVRLFSFTRATPVLDLLEKGENIPDVIFLDIEIPGIGGIELAKRIKLYSPKTWIVFVTGFSQYAVEAFRMHAKGYIVKPVTAAKILEELSAPCHIPLRLNGNNTIKAKCFGNFEVFVNNEPLKFERSKTKELFAYLIDRNGASVNTAELCALLWEDEPDTVSQRNYFRKLVIDLSKTLSAAGADDVFIKSRNSFAIDAGKIDCDYYSFLKRDADSVNSYTGEYMAQYSWAELTLAGLIK